MHGKVLLIESLANGGLTLDVGHDKPFRPDHGYIVSIKKYEYILPLNFFCVNDILGYIDQFKSILYQKDHYFGIWINYENVYFDINLYFEKYDEALQFAIEQKQETFYNCLNKEVIKI